MATTKRLTIQNRPDETWEKKNWKITTTNYIDGEKYDIVGYLTIIDKKQAYVTKELTAYFDPMNKTNFEIRREYIPLEDVDADWIIDYREVFNNNGEIVKKVGTLVKIRND